MFPTCVGMNRADRRMSDMQRMSVPHMRGDEPIDVMIRWQLRCSVPHMRGDEPKQETTLFSQEVFPTCVGMNR